MDLNHKVVLITGASSGIGYSIAKLLPKEKCSLALLSRNENKLNDLVKEINSTGLRAEAYQCDVRNSDDVRNSFVRIKNKFGRIDIAILNAGISSRKDVGEYSSANAKEIFETNTLGIVNCVEQLLPDFMLNRRGMIIGVSSLAESRGFPRSGFYNASKSAASLLLESLRIELKPYNIKVLTVKPGFVRTPMTDKNEFHMPFLMDVDKAAKIILDGIKKEKRIIQFPLPIVLGAKMLKFIPDFIFDYLMSKKLPAKKNY